MKPKTKEAAEARARTCEAARHLQWLLRDEGRALDAAIVGVLYAVYEQATEPDPSLLSDQPPPEIPATAPAPAQHRHVYDAANRCGVCGIAKRGRKPQTETLPAVANAEAAAAAAVTR